MHRIVGHAGAGHAQQAAVLAIGLLDYRADTRAQRKMQKEFATGDYNLNTLRVDATATDISETPFEND